MNQKSRKFFILFAMLFSVLLVSTSAFAQDDALPTAGEAMGGNDGGGDVVYAKESVYDFDADNVEGSIVRPDEANITGEQHGKTSSLIQIRENFVPELIRSVERI